MRSPSSFEGQGSQARGRTACARSTPTHAAGHRLAWHLLFLQRTPEVQHHVPSHPGYVDGSSTSGEGLAEAIRLAKLTGGRLRLVPTSLDELSFALGMDAYAAIRATGSRVLRTNAVALLENARAPRRRPKGRGRHRAARRLQAGAVHDQVVTEAIASKADLIVLGTHGRRGLSAGDGQQRRTHPAHGARAGVADPRARNRREGRLRALSLRTGWSPTVAGRPPPV